MNTDALRALARPNHTTHHDRCDCFATMAAHEIDTLRSLLDRVVDVLQDVVVNSEGVYLDTHGGWHQLMPDEVDVLDRVNGVRSLLRGHNGHAIAPPKSDQNGRRATRSGVDQ